MSLEFDDTFTWQDLIEDIERKHCVSTEFVKEALKQLYPTQIIKRILFRPVVGKWFPYLDVHVPNKEFQASFFYGKVHARISQKRFCARCGKTTKEHDFELNFLPLALCKECRAQIFYDYWDCLRECSQGENEYSGDIQDKDNATGSVQVPCANLLKPRCGFPIEGERTNPCLKDHAIGLVMQDSTTIQVFIGPRAKLKYYMIWNGGILGVILGKPRIIMNLEILQQHLTQFIQLVQSIVRQLNRAHNSQSFGENYPSSDEGSSHKIKLVSPFPAEPNTLSSAQLGKWLLYAFLSYYDNKDIRRFYHSCLRKPVIVLKELLTKILDQKDLQVLEMLDLQAYFTPLERKLRKSLEKKFTSICQLDIMRDFSMDALSFNTFQNLSEAFGSFQRIEWQKLKGELEIYEVLCACGSNLLIESNLASTPILLNSHDLIGRRIA